MSGVLAAAGEPPPAASGLLSMGSQPGPPQTGRVKVQHPSVLACDQLGKYEICCSWAAEALAEHTANNKNKP